MPRSINSAINIRKGKTAGKTNPQRETEENNEEYKETAIFIPPSKFLRSS